MKRLLTVLVMAVVTAFMASAGTAQAAALHGRALAHRLSGVPHAGASHTAGLALVVAVAVSVAVVVCAATLPGAVERRRQASRGHLARLSRAGSQARHGNRAA